MDLEKAHPWGGNRYVSLLALSDFIVYGQRGYIYMQL